ncbi:MAG: helix-turn-helix domain-containing protein [Planctomycetes bacterium]|nr:helix-turn-helix domain-containing protein [Planctomycetota bacterium]
MKERIHNESFPNPDWLRHMADAEDRCRSVAVAGLAQELGMLQNPAWERPRILGRLIEYARRDKGLSLEALAKAADVGLAEVVAIEMEADVLPLPRTVVQIAQVLGLPAATITELAGLARPQKMLSEAAVRFAARSEPTARLSIDEREAFEEFVKVIVETST